GAYAWLTRDVTSEVRQLSPHAGKAYLSVGWYGSWGGAQTLNGFSTGGRTDEQQVRVTYQQFITPTLEGNISLNHDVSANGQFKQGFGLLLRLAKIF
ncbi:MAG: hypothetical protein JO111_08305, partial [Caulobacteraceae bacterium]|nr:hypothetical protein [Caulobacteraceae bacterium]